jgi:MYXO-CTERM domain-containing protein
MQLISAAALVAASLASPARADVTLQNDGFQGSGTVPVEGGFAVNDICAERFVAPSGGRQLLKLQVLFSSTTGTMTGSFPMTVKVYDDSSGADAPGAELYSMDFQLVDSTSALQEMDLSTASVTVPQQFRAGLVYQHAGYPGNATDGAASPVAKRNYIYDTMLGWHQASTFGVQGNFIFRAVVSGTATGAGDAGVTTPDASNVGATCTGNAQCAVGSFCDTSSHTCTFDCRTNADCGGGTCNSLGMCVGGGKSGGCCSASGGAHGSIALGLGVLGLVFRRRRRA